MNLDGLHLVVDQGSRAIKVHTAGQAQQSRAIGHRSALVRMCLYSACFAAEAMLWSKSVLPRQKFPVRRPHRQIQERGKGILSIIHHIVVSIRRYHVISTAETPPSRIANLSSPTTPYTPQGPLSTIQPRRASVKTIHQPQQAPTRPISQDEHIK